jgi:hypothetical protein
MSSTTSTHQQTMTDDMPSAIAAVALKSINSLFLCKLCVYCWVRACMANELAWLVVHHTQHHKTTHLITSLIVG